MTLALSLFKMHDSAAGANTGASLDVSLNANTNATNSAIGKEMRDDTVSVKEEKSSKHLHSNTLKGDFVYLKNTVQAKFFFLFFFFFTPEFFELFLKSLIKFFGEHIVSMKNSHQENT